VTTNTYVSVLLSPRRFRTVTSIQGAR